MPGLPAHRHLRRGALRRVSLAALALLSAWAASPGATLAQSFDCAKASTAVERLICADAALAALDGALGDEIKKALRAAPANRQGTLAAARAWLKERDRRCPVSGAAPSGGSRAADCLKEIYRERIAQLQAAPAGAAASANSPQSKSPAGKPSSGNTQICERLLHHYREALASAPKAPGGEPAEEESPLRLLAASKGAAVSVTGPAAQISDYSREKVIEWAQSQPQPFKFSDAILTALDDISGLQFIERLPNANYYAATSIQGTALCYAQVFFSIKDGQTVSAEAPTGWEDEAGGGCGAARSFGSVGGTSVAFEESHGYSPSLTSSLTTSPWQGDHFGPACSISLTFAPRFSTKASVGPVDESCDGADCDDLRRAAMKLVEQVQRDFASAEKSAVARLTPAQHMEYETLKSHSTASSATGGETPPEPVTDADSLLDTSPLVAPLVHNGQLYLASVGHMTMGWRVYSDWSVKLERFKDGALEPRATLAIGMSRGPLMKATVQ